MERKPLNPAQMTSTQLVVGRRYRAIKNAPADMFLLGEGEHWNKLDSDRFHDELIRQGTVVELINKGPYIVRAIDDTVGMHYWTLPAHLLHLFIPLDEKAPAIENLLGSLASMFGQDRKESMAGSKCVYCGKPATEFKDDLSRREYGISGFCQACQDDTFGGGE